MSKIVYTKRTSAIFLAIVLVTGTIATILPSFMTTEVAQAQPYYDDDRMYNDYNSYGPTDYGMDNDRKSYDNSYYKSQYSSYDKHDRDKSKKDSKKSVLINKLNCINTNLNINGNNTGDINLGNKGAAEEGYLGGYSSTGGSGYGGGYDGQSKKDKGFECIINNNNNNTNTNIVTVGGGNVTNGGGNQTDACEECFNANATLAGIITAKLAIPGAIQLGPVLVIPESVTTIPLLCNFLEEQIAAGNILQTVRDITSVISIILLTDSPTLPPVSEASITALVNCLLEVDFG